MQLPIPDRRVKRDTDGDVYTTALFGCGVVSARMSAARCGCRRKVARSLDARIVARNEAANDRRLLNQMTERDLRDIGISRAELQAIGVGWFA